MNLFEATLNTRLAQAQVDQLVNTPTRDSQTHLQRLESALARLAAAKEALVIVTLAWFAPDSNAELEARATEYDEI